MYACLGVGNGHLGLWLKEQQRKWPLLGLKTTSRATPRVLARKERDSSMKGRLLEVGMGVVGCFVGEARGRNRERDDES